MDQGRVGDFGRYGTQGEEGLNGMYDIFIRRIYSYIVYSARTLNKPVVHALISVCH